MKKAIYSALAFTLLLAGCSGGGTKPASSAAPAGPDTAKGEGVMTYADYIAAADEDEVTVEAYVQAKQNWWEDTATIYAQDADGGYFFYGVKCSEEDYAKLVEGQKIKVTGFKSTWSGEVEVVDGSFELEEGNWVAEAKDVTAALGTDALINDQNLKVSFKGMKVEPSQNKDGQEVAWTYKWDDSGEEGDDLYFNVSSNGKTYSFTVESYLCDQNSDVYKAVKELKVGDVIDMEGFLYWYEGPNPHITSVKAAN
ncbi:MAG: hypothetical protein IKS37_10020 [Solobacterium sp.]|nr:hypothetical protein [Solobacterium sp.]